MSLGGYYEKPFKHNKRRKSPEKKLPEDYYTKMSISKNGYDMVNLVAEIEKISKKQALERMVYVGYHHCWGFVFNENKVRNMANTIVSKNTPKIRASRAINYIRRKSNILGLFSTYKLKKFGL